MYNVHVIEMYNLIQCTYISYWSTETNDISITSVHYMRPITESTEIKCIPIKRISQFTYG